MSDPYCEFDALFKVSTEFQNVLELVKRYGDPVSAFGPSVFKAHRQLSVSAECKFLMYLQFLCRTTLKLDEARFRQIQNKVFLSLCKDVEESKEKFEKAFKVMVETSPALASIREKTKRDG